MDTRPKDTVSDGTKDVNHYTAEFIEQATRDSGRTTAVAFVVGLLVLFGMLIYTRYSLIAASGLYQVESVNGVIETAPIIDENHYFDDRVAMVQTATARHLTSIFNHTSTSFEFMGEVFDRTTTEHGRNDVLANLNHFGILSKMYGTEVVQLNFVLKQTPIIVKPYYAEGTLESDIENPDTRNMLDVEKWTVEVKGIITYGSILATTRESLPVVFTVDIIPIMNKYKISTLIIDRISLWEIER